MNETKYRQQDGTVLTLVLTPDGEYICTDIEIPDEVRTLVLGMEHDRVSYHLRDVFKCFPNVEELCILETVRDIRISNFMFPNVRHVESKNDKYASGYDLIMRRDVSRYRKENVFLNTFCIPDRKVLDLSHYENYYNDPKLGDYALEGSFIEDILWRESSYMKIGDRVFKGNSANLKPTDSGVIKVGNAIVGFDKDAEEIVMPEDIEENLCEDDQNFKKLVINSPKQLNLISSNSSIDVLYVDSKAAFGLKLAMRTNYRTKKIKINPENPYYSEEDGILYSKDKSSIVVFPRLKEGHFSIPEGVSEIGSMAFSYSKISSVSFPDSLRFLGDSAFYGSEIENIEFGNGLTQIGGLENRSVFSGCKKLKEVEIPSSVSIIGDSAFSGCRSLEKITLNDGILEIGSNTFSMLDNLKSITIPSSVKTLRLNSFGSIRKISFESDSVPIGFAQSVFDNRKNTTKESYYDSSILSITTPGGNEYILPHAQNPDSFSKWNAIQFFSEVNPDDTPDMACDDRTKQDLIIRMWNSFRSEEKRNEYGKSIRRIGKKICQRLIIEEKEDLLAAFAETGLLTKNAAQDVLEFLPESMISAKARLLEIVSKEKKKRRNCL